MLSILPRYASTVVCMSSGVPTSSPAPPARFTSHTFDRVPFIKSVTSDFQFTSRNNKTDIAALCSTLRDAVIQIVQSRHVQEIRLCLLYVRRQTPLFGVVSSWVEDGKWYGGASVAYAARFKYCL